jgi:threonine dehydrogenase-like Zn-dependent dehydrogenase
MKAVVFHGVGDIRLENVPEPEIQEPMDAIVRITTSAICGTDLHMVRGTMAGMAPGTILGHEGVGIVEDIGRGVRNLRKGDRVVIPSTIACGYCSYCRAGYYAMCDNANPNGKHAGPAFFGGPRASGPFNGLQAEYARIPFANVGLVKLPGNVTDDQAITISDIFPTGYFGADVAEIESGDVVAVFGCGPVGLMAIVSARLMGAGRVIAIDHVPDRLERARQLGAEVIDFSQEDPVEAMRELTGGIGADRAIDAVGVDAEMPKSGPVVEKLKQQKEEFDREVRQIAPRVAEGWGAGNAPSLALCWAVEGLAKAGTLSIIGVYPQQVKTFPIGEAMHKNLTIQGGDCNHRKYLPTLLDIVESGVVDSSKFLTNKEPFDSVIDAYKAFDEHQPGWIKVELKTAA